MTTSAVTGSLALAVLLAVPAAATGDAVAIEALVEELNLVDSVAGSDEIKSWRVLFDAYVEMGPPPFPVGDAFNLTTIHPGMTGWPAVKGWAESHPAMATAILDAASRTIVGLPYGVEMVPASYVEKGVVAEIAVGGNMLLNRFPHLDAVDEIAAFATAETYRLLEAGLVDEGLDLALAHCFLLRQFCDREFLVEKLRGVRRLSEALSNLRDVFHRYQDDISQSWFREIAKDEIPFLRADRGRLLMPEADRVVAEHLMRTIFNERDATADPERFAAAFTEVQSADAPLTRFGVAREWRKLAMMHGSLDASLDRLQLIYDDWWRRWRIQEYDPLLDMESQLERTNAVRYAAVIASVQDMHEAFSIRNRLIAEVNGTAMAAGLCAYHAEHGRYPDKTEKIYTAQVRRSSDTDPFSQEFDVFRYRYVRDRTPVDAGRQRIWIEPGNGLLYSVGANHEDDRAAVHAVHGQSGDLLLWPPARALLRAQGGVE